MIDFQNVSFSYGAQAATISNISFHVNPGECVAIICENGAGKTSVSKMIMGLLKPTHGKVTVNGKDTKTTRVSELASFVGYLFQNPDMQICQKTVKEEIAFGLHNVTAKSDTEIDQIVDQVVAQFGFRPDAEPFNLSRGDRQRVALASLIALEPQLLILDEPTTGLDYTECIEIMTAISQMNRLGVTVLMVCHDMEIVQDFAQRVIVMAKGNVIAQGTADEIFRDAGTMEKAAIMPPQIIQLGMRLGSGFADVSTVSELVDAISTMRGR